MDYTQRRQVKRKDFIKPTTFFFLSFFFSSLQHIYTAADNENLEFDFLEDPSGLPDIQLADDIESAALPIKKDSSMILSISPRILLIYFISNQTTKHLPLLPSSILIHPVHQSSHANYSSQQKGSHSKAPLQPL
jgi:hypothetical protein